MMDNQAQVTALGARPPCPRCGTPSSPRGHGYTSAGYACPPVDVVAALREELAHAQYEARTALLALGGQLAAAERERDALREAAREHLAALDARRLAADLRDGVPVCVSVRGEPWDGAYLAACERAFAAAVVLRAAVAGEVCRG